MLLADRPTTSRWAPPPTEANTPYQVRPILEGKNRGRHFARKTPSPGSQIALEPDLGSASDPTRTVARAGTHNATPGLLFSCRCIASHDRSSATREAYRATSAARLPCHERTRRREPVQTIALRVDPTGPPRCRDCCNGRRLSLKGRDSASVRCWWVGRCRRVRLERRCEGVGPCFRPLWRRVGGGRPC